MVSPSKGRRERNLGVRRQTMRNPWWQGAPLQIRIQLKNPFAVATRRHIVLSPISEPEPTLSRQDKIISSASLVDDCLHCSRHTTNTWRKSLGLCR
jgi:hypothetical protein